MPNCFTLTRVGEDSPSPLARVDDEMCRYFGWQPDPDFYAECWVDIEGLYLALGKSWDYMAAQDETGERAPIREFLRTYYQPDAWFER